jgi:hypothetical protein
MRGRRARVGCKLPERKAVKIINKISPNMLSTNVVRIGTKGRRARGKTTFLTKLGCAMTLVDAPMSPPVKAIQGIRPEKSQRPKTKELSPSIPFRLNLTWRTIEKT